MSIAEPQLGLDACGVFFDGTLTDPQLDHPEGIAVHADGSVWCGGEQGQIFRIEPDGRAMEQIASTGGFCLGVAFGPAGDLYVCDVKHAAVMRVDVQSGAVETFADGASGRRMRNPNFPAFDADGRLYVSDSNAMHEPGPGVYRFLPDGSGELWYGRDVNFANGLALAPDDTSLFVAETFSGRVFRLPIEPDGSAGEREELFGAPGVLPDGLAFGNDGTLYVACYHPSQILVVPPPYRKPRVLVRDDEAHLLCHPTNVALRGRTLLAANLGRWHVTAVTLP